MGPSPDRACSVDMVLTTSITSQRESFLIYTIGMKTHILLWKQAVNNKGGNLIIQHDELTSSSGTPNLRSSCLAFLSESLLRSASVPVTVFLTGWGSLSSWGNKTVKKNKPVALMYISSVQISGNKIPLEKSNLLLGGLVGHFHIGETLPTACGICHTSHLQQTLSLHGRNERSCCVPRSCPHLWQMKRVGVNPADCFKSSKVWICKCIQEGFWVDTSSSIFIWKSSSFSSSGAKKDFSPYPASCDR